MRAPKNILVLKMLYLVRAHTLPLVTDKIEDGVIMNFEELVSEGLVSRDAPRSGCGPTYRLTQAGVVALKEYEKKSSQ